MANGATRFDITGKTPLMGFFPNYLGWAHAKSRFTQR